MLLPVSPLSTVERWLLVNEGTNQYWFGPSERGQAKASVAVSRLTSHCHPSLSSIRRSAAVASVRCPSRLSPLVCAVSVSTMSHRSLSFNGTRDV